MKLNDGELTPTVREILLSMYHNRYTIERTHEPTDRIVLQAWYSQIRLGYAIYSDTKDNFSNLA